MRWGMAEPVLPSSEECIRGAPPPRLPFALLVPLSSAGMASANPKRLRVAGSRFYVLLALLPSFRTAEAVVTCHDMGHCSV